MSDAYFKRYQSFTPHQRELHRLAAEYGESCVKLGRELQRAGVESPFSDQPEAVRTARSESSALWHTLVDLIERGETNDGAVPGQLVPSGESERPR
jgi:hypothetical protein